MWNCAGFRASATSTASKFSFFDSQVPNASFSIAALVETHHKDASDFSQEVGQFQETHHILHSPVKNETHSGIILLISKQFEIIEHDETIPGRLLNVRLKDQGNELNFSVFYGPQWAKMSKEHISNTLSKINSIHDSTDNNIIIGDFNFAEFDVDKGKNMDSRDKMIKRQWDDFLTKKGIIDPFRVQCPHRKIYSFTTSMGKSRGDRVYTNEDSMARIKNLRYIHTPFPTAHKIMMFNLEQTKKYGPSQWKMNSSILSDTIYKKEIEEIFQELQAMDIINPLDWWDLFIMVVQGTTMTYTRKKARIRKSLKQLLSAQIENLEKVEHMTTIQNKTYLHYKARLNELLRVEIRGHEIRTKGQPKYEINEPDINMYSIFEKRYQSQNVIYQLADEEGHIQSEQGTLQEIAKKYYTKLFQKTKTRVGKQDKVLSKIVKKISDADRRNLDAPLTIKELEKAVMSLLDNKSPGPDGITAEFYKKFWYLIKDKYLAYINAAKIHGFRDFRNTSSTTIIYKRKGEVYDLANYRPIALLNIDIKILTKTLSCRLRLVLPSIIHHSQTAVDGRKIDHTCHLIRDIIDLINKDDSEGALLFLDQEKAFDRVEHDFLFKILATFGIGPQFINWLKVLYKNAYTTVKINGFLTEPIPLARGLRQGCPLSPPLYVTVIEIFALQLRSNPNIVGFTVTGEKIISAHYADDATIIITQNQCFKEVIKEIEDYEQASGAKVNYGKTKGLWIGSWKGRTDEPLGITWTSGSVKNLGIYFGNDNTAEKTFLDIAPKVERSMNYWKQFKLSKFAKARIIEIFHASRLWYASTYYPIPPGMKKALQTSFKDYVNFPRHKNPTVSEAEMKKLRLHGGIKLIDIQTKVDTSRSMWLMELVHNPNLKTHLAVMNSLLGIQKGGLVGSELLFTDTYYCNRLLKCRYSEFYAEGFKATAKLSLSKRILNLNEEKKFYNPIFRDVNLKPLSITRRCERQGVFTYREVTEEYFKQCMGEPHLNYVANIFTTIVHYDIAGKADNTIFLWGSQAKVSFGAVTYKNVYEELLRKNYIEHHSVAKWEHKFSDILNWEKIWDSVNNPVATEHTKSTIWEQIHLNDYCTYSYNKWHNNQDKCPLCTHIPSTKFHLTLECQVTSSLWQQLEPYLLYLTSSPVSDFEKVFGLIGTSPEVILRNWLTFTLRQCIVDQENAAYHNKRGILNEHNIKQNFNARVKREVNEKNIIYSNLGRQEYFVKIFAAKDFLITWENDEWHIVTFFSN